ncbi:MAG: hypothetical protein SFY80_15875 [Verrucomicrobiota bacterium]|nr:hypothetical protein [Verrucomicrobiota bacterium]
MKTLLCLFATCLLGTLPAAAVVNLYYTPSPELPPAVIVDDDNPLLGNAIPATDAAARAAGWSTVERPGKYRGFVDVMQIDKSLSVKVGAPVYLKADDSSLVITTIKEGDNTQVLWQGDFWEVQFEKTMTLYVKPPTQAAPVLIPAAAGAGAASTSAIKAPVNATRTTPLPPPLRPAGVQPPTRPNQAAVPSGTPAEGLAMDFIGVLQRARPIALVMDPPFPHELIGPDGERVAYVDFSQALISQPLDTYLGKRVTIYGNRSTIKDGDKLVIKAHNIRMR